MILYPSIEIRDGAVHQLVRDEDGQAVISDFDPAEQARHFQSSGCEWIHIVDYNGACEGHTVNAAAVEAILRSVRIPVQLGGGIRDLTAIESWLSKGVSRVVLGTIARRSPHIVREACRLFPNRIAVSIDARGGFVAVAGWGETEEMRPLDLALRYED